MFWGVLGARVGVFGGLGVLALVWLGLPCRFFPVSKLTKDRRLVCVVRCCGCKYTVVVSCSARTFPPGNLADLLVHHRS